MPKIDISERDLTQATGTVGTDIVFIPGFISNQYKYTEVDRKEWKKSDYKGTELYIRDSSKVTGYKKIDKADWNQIDTKATTYERSDITTTKIEIPVLCTSIREFESIFGKDPYTFTEAITEHSIEIGDIDRSYIMAKELLSEGMPIYYFAVKPSDKTETGQNLIEYLLKKVSDNLSELLDVGEYSIKYITTGGYSNFKDGEASSSDISAELVKISANRGDSISIIEASSALSIDPNDATGLFKKICAADSAFNDGGEFATIFAAWGYYNLTQSYYCDYYTKNPPVEDVRVYNKIKTSLMPACFGYLLDLAVNIKTSPNWLAMAGTTRGIVPRLIRLATAKRLSNTIANDYQPTKAVDGKRAINAITDIKPYGLTIWGNRTLKTIEEDGLTATNFLNTRNMISDIKKVAYRAAKAQLFEQNSEVLWLNFKAEVSPFLEQLKKGNGISDYKLLKLDTKYDGSSLGKEEFACAIKIFPMYAVESFEITVVVSDNDVSVG